MKKNRFASSSMRGFAAALIALLLILIPKFASADETALVNEGSGSFAMKVPFDVPPFHRLSPSIGLTYSSTTLGTGFTGVGWGLYGFSVMQRMGGHRGVPSWDATDAFALDGVELVRDTSMGGTFSTRVQNFSAITFDAASDSWHLVGTNGVVTTYRPILRTAQGTLRWGIASNVDLHGNTVTYAWQRANPSSEVYPASISYGGTTITFWREGRSDPAMTGIGGTTVSMDRRLKTVDIVVDGKRARAYRIGYVLGQVTARSLLHEVRAYGSDATIDGDGNITGGTALPPLTVATTVARADLRSPSPWLQPYGPAYEWMHPGGELVGDIDGNGRPELVIPTASGWFAAQVASEGIVAPTKVLSPRDADGYSTNSPIAFLQDVTADGIADLVYVRPYGLGWMVAVAVKGATGPHFAAPQTWLAPTVDNHATWSSGSQAGLADFDGDGTNDVYFSLPNDGFYVALSRRDHFERPVRWAPSDVSGLGTEHLRFVGDLDGDHRADILGVRSTDNMWVAMRSTGASFGEPRVWLEANSIYGPTHNQGYEAIFDATGDGLPDLVIAMPWTGIWITAVSTGSSFSTPVPAAAALARGFVLNKRFAIDADGDGRKDLVVSFDGRGWFVLRSNGDGTFAAPTLWSEASTDDPYLFADWNGDGRDDLVTFDPNVGWLASLSGEPLDLVTTVMNGLGGDSSITYVPSTHWSNTLLPPGTVFPTVSQVTTSDGRGGLGAVSYEYEGGLYSFEEQRFLGFARATRVDNFKGTVFETYFHLDVGTLGAKPEREYMRDSAGNIYHSTAYVYTENNSPPYTSFLTERWRYQCELTTSCRRQKEQFAYDVWANLVAEYRYGDFDVIGDETIVARGYSPNRANHLTSLAAYENTYSATQKGDTLVKSAMLAHTVMLYDGGGYLTPPQKGDLTGSLVWDSLDGSMNGSFATFDSYGNQTSSVDAEGGVWTTVWDSKHHIRPVTKCDPLNHCEQLLWEDQRGVKLRTTDANGGINETRYDVFGRPVTQVHPDRSATRTSYVNLGSASDQYTQVVAPDGSWKRIYTDGLGRGYRTLRSDGVETQTIFADMSTNPSRVSRPFLPDETPQYFTYVYDGELRPVRTAAPDGASTTIRYEAGPGTASVTHVDPLGHEKVDYSDIAGRIINTIEKYGATSYSTKRTYDRRGRLVMVRDARGNTTLHTYSSLAEIRKVDPDLGTLSFEYDRCGRKIATTDAKGTTIEDVFDKAGRRIERHYPDGTASLWNYDEPGHGPAVGRLTSVVYSKGSESYIYDLPGHVVTMSLTNAGVESTMRTTYGPNGRVTSQVFPDGEIVEYGYDSIGRLIRLGALIRRRRYDSSDRLVGEDRADGTTGTWTYSNRGWLTSSSLVRGTKTLYRADYTRDADGSITAIEYPAEPCASERFAYDELHRLISATVGGHTDHFTYDAIGNMRSSPAGVYQYGDRSHVHAHTRVGDRAYTWDENGNLVEESGGPHPRKLSWTADNQLRTITTNSGVTQFEYDAHGTRISKTSTDGTKSLYFGPNVAIEDASAPIASIANGKLVKYYWAGTTLIAKRDASGVFYYFADHGSSVRRVTNAAGTVVDAPTFSAYGRPASDVSRYTSPAGITETIGWKGLRADEDSELVDVNARFYDPSIGRYTSADPVAVDTPAGLNRYSYAFNDPVGNIDATGHFSFFGVLAALIGTFSAYNPLTAFTATKFFSLLGGALTTTGLLANDERLLTVGNTMLGFSRGPAIFQGSGILGSLTSGTVAAALSPMSPLGSDAKRAVGWAWGATDIIGTLHPPGTFHPPASSNTDGLPTLSGKDLGALRKEVPQVVEAWHRGRTLVLNLNGVLSGGFVPANIAHCVQDMFTKMPETEAIQRFLSEHADQFDGVEVAYGESMGAAIAVNMSRYMKVKIDTLQSIPFPSLLRLGVESAVLGQSHPILSAAGTHLSFGTTDPISLNFGGMGPGLLLGRASGLPIVPLSTGPGYLIGPHTNASTPRSDW